MDLNIVIVFSKPLGKGHFGAVFRGRILFKGDAMPLECAVKNFDQNIDSGGDQLMADDDIRKEMEIGLSSPIFAVIEFRSVFRVEQYRIALIIVAFLSHSVPDSGLHISKHENVVELFGVYQYLSRHLIVMELMDGNVDICFYVLRTELF